MQLQRVLSGAVMVAAVAALPADLISQGPSNVLAPVQSFHDTPPVVANTEPFVSLATEKRGVSAPIGYVERTVAKRATLTVDIWMDINGGGRHEGLITDTQRCFNLLNGWNDQISSLSVPSGFGCIFYEDINCDNNDHRLTVTGSFFVANAGDYGFNDIISSYLCYN
ncbi:hypothetical protein GGS24DRAFT_502523 [Hypoxylon argillaceum]|nr:hypothetical protein GGS24DRAFT_502523 [Hypoxylon argillaceum]